MTEQWISVKEKEPAQHQSILVTNGRTIHAGTYYVETGKFCLPDNVRFHDTETGETFGMYWSLEDHYTHWMPAPEAYSLTKKYNTQLDTLQSELDAWIDTQAEIASKRLLTFQGKSLVRSYCADMVNSLQRLAWQQVNNEFENSRLRLCALVKNNSIKFGCFDTTM